MLDTSRIYAQLSAPLQQRLAQLALLQQRAAVLARLPALTLAKGKPVRWAATPAPMLLKQVMVLAALDGAPRLSALLLHNWFQHKMELCYQVRRALISNNYLVPPVGVLPRPSATVMRLDPRDVGPGDTGRFFYPSLQPLGEMDATPEEVTLMAGLLGWCVRRPGLNELDDNDERVRFLKLTYRSLEYFEDMLADVLASLPAAAPAAQAAARGELPAEVDEAFEKTLNWAERYRLFLPLRDSMCVALEPAPAPGCPRVPGRPRSRRGASREPDAHLAGAGRCPPLGAGRAGRSEPGAPQPDTRFCPAGCRACPGQCPEHAGRSRRW